MMGKLEWHDGLNIGVPELDAQHRDLIRMINAILESLKKGSQEEAVDKLLIQLREYTVHHFNSEEKYMERIEYPDLNRHRQIHKQLKDRVKFLQSARFRKERVEWSEMKELLLGWLINHILHEDYKIAQYVKSGGGGQWKP